MAYHVNDDIPTKITMVHRDSCKEAQVRTKLPQNGKWYEYLPRNNSKDEALEIAHSTGRLADTPRNARIATPSQ